MAEDLLSRIIKGYRQDPKTGKPETLPTKLDRRQVLQLASGLNTAVEFGMPKIGLDQLPNKILLEGRADAGTNEFNVNNRYAKDLHEVLLASNVDPLSATYAAAVLDKSQVAQRLGIPFERAWNGTGKSAQTGKTGAQHAAKAAKSQDAAEFPQNAELIDTIRRAVTGQLTPQENLLMMDRDKLAKAVLGVDSNQPFTVPSYSSDARMFSPATLAAAGNKLRYARNQATLEERTKSKLLFDSDVAQALPDAYLQAAGVEMPNYGFWGRSAKDSAKDPLIKYMTGEAAPQYQPPPPTLLDRIKEFFQ